MKSNLTLLIITFAFFSSIADVPFVAYREGRWLANAEFLASIEPTFKHDLSLPIWGGFALVAPLQGEHNTKGFEVAVELRKNIPIGPNFSGFFVSGYAGMAAMEITEYYRDQVTGRAWFPGASLGAKAGYRLVPFAVQNRASIWSVWLEPYFSVSFSSFSRAGTLVNSDNPLLTIGIRAVTGFVFRKS